MQGFLNRRERKERRVVSASVHSVCSCSEFVCNQAPSTWNGIANLKSESRYPKQIQNPNCECPKGAREGRQSARIRSVAGGSRPYARLPTSDPPLPYSTTPPLHHVLSVVRGPFLSVVIREIRGLALEITQSTLDRMHRIHRMEGIDFGLLGAHSVPLGDTLTLLLFPCWHFRGPPRTAVETAVFRPFGGRITGCGGRCSENLIIVRPWQIAMANLVAQEAVNGRSLTPNGAVGRVVPRSLSHG